jgi:hypothetical protein
MFLIRGSQQSRTKQALGEAVEVKAVPKTIAGGQIQCGANQATTSKGQGLIDGYDSSAPMPGIQQDA